MLNASMSDGHCSISVLVNEDVKTVWVISGIRQCSTQGKLHKRHHPRGTVPERHNALECLSTQEHREKLIQIIHGVN